MNNIDTAEEVKAEATFRVKNGEKQLSIKQLKQELACIGYRLDRRMDCKGKARHIVGARSGAAYPALNVYPVEASTGLSWCNIHANRGKNFQALKQLRNSVFAVAHGAIVSW